MRQDLGPDGRPFEPMHERIAQADGDETAVLHELWQRMVLIRRHEELIERLNAEGRIRGSTHLYIGMEAGAVGVAAALHPGDRANGYYRCHGHALALGVPPAKVVAEILAREPGCCRGRGGSKHLMDVSVGYYGAHAIVGQQVPIAVGLALDLQRREPSAEHIVACFFGDGAVNQGVTLEALNLASILGAPCLFICENNRYAVSSGVDRMLGGGSFTARAEGFGIPAREVDGMDVTAVRDAVAQARQEILESGQPRALELATYRYAGHSVFFVGEGLRPEAEVAYWRSRDPIEQAARRLVDAGRSRAELEAQDRAIVSFLDDVADWALAQPASRAPRQEDVYA